MGSSAAWLGRQPEDTARIRARIRAALVFFMGSTPFSFSIIIAYSGKTVKTFGFLNDHSVI